MDRSAPKGVMQSAGQPAQDLHRKVSAHLNQAGYRVTPQSVNPDDQSPLKGIEEAIGDTTHVVGSTFEELVSGSNDITHVRTAEGKVPVLIALKKRFLKKHRNSQT